MGEKQTVCSLIYNFNIKNDKKLPVQRVVFLNILMISENQKHKNSNCKISKYLKKML